MPWTQPVASEKVATSRRRAGSSRSRVSVPGGVVRNRMRRVGSLRSFTAGARSIHSHSRWHRVKIARTNASVLFTVAC